MPRHTFVQGLVLAALLLAPGSSEATAGEATALAKGTRVRIRLVEPRFGSLSTPKSVEGTLVGLTASLVTIDGDPDDGQMTIAVDNIERLEQNVRRGGRTRGAIVGAGIGAAGGLLYGALVVGDTRDDVNDWSDNSALESGAFWAALAAPVGALVGSLVAPSSEWSAVGLDNLTMELSLVAGERIGANVTVRF